MFNKNGSNNGNGSANGPVGLVARNGNGHKPDAAIPAEHDPASSAGLALLWDGLSPAVTQALGQPLDPSLASQRKGRKGQVYDYLEGHAVIAQANRIFGYGGWGYELVGDVTLRRIETVNPQTGEVKVEQGYSAPVRVTVAGALPRTDIGVHPVAEDNFDGHDTAIKGAVTDGLKRAFRSFGAQFGNGVLRGPAAGRQPAATAARSRPVQRQVRPVPIQRQELQFRQAQSLPSTGSGADAQRVPGGDAAEDGSSRSHPSRASTRTRCGRPWWTGRARASTTWTAAELGPLVEAAANKLRQMQQAQSLPRT